MTSRVRISLPPPLPPHPPPLVTSSSSSSSSSSSPSAWLTQCHRQPSLHEVTRWCARGDTALENERREVRCHGKETPLAERRSPRALVVSRPPWSSRRRVRALLFVTTHSASPPPVRRAAARSVLRVRARRGGGARCSALGARRSVLGARCSVRGARCAVRGARRPYTSTCRAPTRRP